MYVTCACVNAKEQDALKLQLGEKKVKRYSSFGKGLKEWEELLEMKLQKKGGEFWAEKIQVTSFSHYPSKLTLRLQGDVREAELSMRWDGEWLLRLFCAL